MSARQAAQCRWPRGPTPSLVGKGDKCLITGAGSGPSTCYPSSAVVAGCGCLPVVRAARRRPLVVPSQLEHSLSRLSARAIQRATCRAKQENIYSSLWMSKMASDALDPHQNGESALSSGSQFGSTSQASTSAANMAESTAHPTDFASLMRTHKEYEELTTVFYTIYINDTRFEILKRYDKLKMIGSGAQGVVW